MEIILSTLNARYSHSSFGLRYLYANLRDLKSRALIQEFTISQNAKDIVENLLKLQPKIIGFGVYIWNAKETLEIVQILKKVAPEIIVVLGGPEISYESETQSIFQIADYTIKGEADFLFYEFCKRALDENFLPKQKLITGELPKIEQIESPYAFYTDHDIQNRVLYVEASRGCPYKCEYCLSSLDQSVRNFNTQHFLADMQLLLDRGARQFKFIDRTFNLSPSISTQILKFFLDRINLGLFLHFEMVPDRLPDELKTLIVQFPKGSLQFEIGVQTWNPVVAKNVSRRQNYELVKQNISFLSQKTGVHMHVDLIVGLPGETLESFAEGFDALFSLNPDEVQVGILKRLKGTPIIRHDEEFKMAYQDTQPFQILKNRDLNFHDIQKMVKFSKYWDLCANSGNFITSMNFILSAPSLTPPLGSSPFQRFMKLTEFLIKRHPESHGIALNSLAESIYHFLLSLSVLEAEAKSLLLNDFSKDEKRSVPGFLHVYKTRNTQDKRQNSTESVLPERQRRRVIAAD